MAMTALVLASTAYSAYASDKAGQAQQDIANRNADLTEKQADQAQKQGDQQVMDVRRRVRRIQGAQRAGYAAQGVDVGTGAPVDIAGDTESQGIVDEQTVRTNTALSVWGFKTGSANERFAGRQYRTQGRMAATSTIINGLGQSYGTYSHANGIQTKQQPIFDTGN